MNDIRPEAERFFVVVGNELRCVIAGESGYFPCPMANGIKPEAAAEALNSMGGHSQQDVDKAVAASMFPAKQETFSLDHLEAAACIWEHVLEHKDRYDNDEGAAELRMKTIQLAPFVDSCYRLAHNDLDYDDCFDWDFVPVIVSAIHDQFLDFEVPEMTDEQKIEFIKIALSVTDEA